MGCFHGRGIFFCQFQIVSLPTCGGFHFFCILLSWSIARVFGAPSSVLLILFVQPHFPRFFPARICRDSPCFIIFPHLWDRLFASIQRDSSRDRNIACFTAGEQFWETLPRAYCEPAFALKPALWARRNNETYSLSCILLYTMFCNEHVYVQVDQLATKLIPSQWFESHSPFFRVIFHNPHVR